MPRYTMDHDALPAFMNVPWSWVELPPRLAKQRRDLPESRDYPYGVFRTEDEIPEADMKARGIVLVMSAEDEVLPYHAVRCNCGYRNAKGELTCQDWHVTGVADQHGVKFTQRQARAVAALLNVMELQDG